jgi:hypothetical protein
VYGLCLHSDDGEVCEVCKVSPWCKYRKVLGKANKLFHTLSRLGLYGRATREREVVLQVNYVGCCNLVEYNSKASR